MQITINTAEPLSSTDARILAILAGGEDLRLVPNEEVQPKKAAPKKTAAKKPEPEPEPEPEPMAEEPVAEEPEEEEEEPEESDEDLLERAVKKATKMVADGHATDVRAALDKAGASRVRELNADNVRDFFRALS